MNDTEKKKLLSDIKDFFQDSIISNHLTNTNRLQLSDLTVTHCWRVISQIMLLAITPLNPLPGFLFMQDYSEPQLLPHLELRYKGCAAPYYLAMDQPLTE